MRSFAIFLILFTGGVAALPAQPDEEPIAKRVYETRRAVEPPTIDGRLDDPAWEKVAWAGDFVQRMPTDGDPPSQQTEFKVVYDDDALYFAFRLHDDPGQVTNMLARRDGFPGDWIEVNIDSYFDHRTAFSFTLSLSGTRGDELISNDGSRWDTNWDPVWNGATGIDGDGWTAEMRIPLSQLRFSRAEEQTWGLQIQRRHFRLEERATWQRIPRDVTGWVSRFGELRGLRQLQPKRHIELLPYTVARGEHFAAEPGNPFREGSAADVDAGVDGKIGITNNLTVDFTINPDFGQVEADPSQVNLTAFETYFQEKRPFFIEGNDIFDLRVAPAITGGTFTRDNLFYSRRIGRRPTHDPDVPDGGYAEIPDNTTILGAFKLSGKTAGGLSIGLLESVTAKERAAVDDGGERSHLTVEPWTNYFVGRLQQDYRAGEVQLGGMITAVNRKLDDDALDSMRREAYAGGIDFSSYFRNRDYRLLAVLLGSELRGSEEAVYDAQTSSARYFQRPDNEEATLDPTRTSLSGHAGSIRFTRTSNHELMFQTGVAWRSPGFEINDLGFMRNADEINQFTWVGYRKRNPFSIFDGWGINGNQWLNWDFGGNFLGASYNVNSSANFRNKSGASAGITRNEEHTSNTLLRGGPSMRRPGRWSYRLHFYSDPRRKLRGSVGTYLAHGDENSRDLRQAWFSLTYRPTNAMRLSLSPSYAHNRQEMQYLETNAFGDEDRYLFASLDQKTVVVTLRLDYAITPNLSVQYYGSPFTSTGRYDEFKRITDPQAVGYRDRFRVFAGDEITYDPAAERFDVDEDGNGTFDYGFENPDFDAREFNSNLVIRWEYRPGSTFYLVWSQLRENSSLLVDDPDYHQDMKQLFATHPHNVVLIKVSKWFSP
ncbi:MAG: hypothetical protein GY856_30770 [bacterium]|nr:hypothetical protein [bacterium]